MSEQQPSVGRIVHYVSHGTPGGEYPKACRAAIVTEVHGEDASGHVASLAVLSPQGVFFAARCAQGDELHGDHPPGAYGGTWHWPERV
ncbi:hypothetical protein ACIQSP_16355 [Streptomyces nigra]|uniref:hypothetical protein n=1 Tax=Streptomyces nigra TaxID=1827580 RepID=UPI00380E8C82